MTAGCPYDLDASARGRIDPPSNTWADVWGARDVLTPNATNVERYRFVGLTPTVTAGWGHSRDGRDSRAFVAVVPDFIEL